MRVKASLITIIAMIVLLGSLAVAGAQQAQTAPSLGKGGTAPQPELVNPVMHATMTQNGTVPTGMSPSPGEVTTQVAVGWHYGQVDHCWAYGGYVYVSTKQGETWWTNGVPYYTLEAPACQTGHWLAWYIYDTSGAWNEVYTYTY